MKQNGQGRACLSREETIGAWELERKGMPRWKVALKMNCCEKTIYRAYKRYSAEIKAHEKENEKNAESVSLLQESS